MPSELIAIFSTLLKGILKIAVTWWWLVLPFLFFSALKTLYLYWIEDRWWAKVKWILLEVRIPRDIERPLKAMEQVVSNFWSFHDPPNFKEKWFEGKFSLSFQLEIVSIDGSVHFYIRIPDYYKAIFESAIYSQYPEVEIMEVEDYTKKVPQSLPSKEWDSWGCDYALAKSDCYPIKTYQSFFEPTQEVEEEKRIDPLAVLIEGMSKLQKGEQLWFQLRVQPILAEIPWVEQGKEEVARLVKRPLPPKPKSIVGEAWRAFWAGKEPFAEEAAEEGIIPPEMKLTPGERDIVKAIEDKISKPAFSVNSRFIYLGKRDVFFKPRLRLLLNFSAGLSTRNLNGLKPWGKTITKIAPPAPYRRRRLYMRQRQLFRRYVRRQIPLYPRSGGTFILNSEELATIYHFPGKVGAPTPAFPRIEAKKAGPPPTIPTE